MLHAPLPLTSLRKYASPAVGLISLMWVSPILAQGSSLPYGGGGPTGAYRVVQQYNRTGEPFRIEGRCQSSCTVLLAIRNVCVDPNATLLFHAAVFPGESLPPPRERQARMVNAYNPKLRNYLIRNGYVDRVEFHAISGRDIIQKFGYRACR